MPKISVITVCLNDKIGLETTIKSVVNQSYSDYEYIVVDGGSRDGSTDVIAQFADRISKWVSEKDNGIYHAMNKGIAMSTGEYCLFLNAGDYLADQDVFIKMFEKFNDADIIYGNMHLKKADGEIVFMKSPAKITLRRMLADTLWHPVSFIKRNLFARYGGYDESLRIVADYEFFVRVIIGKKAKLFYVPLVVSVFEESGISSDLKQREQLVNERISVQDKYFSKVLLFIFRLYSKLMN